MNQSRPATWESTRTDPGFGNSLEVLRASLLVPAGDADLDKAVQGFLAVVTSDTSVDHDQQVKEVLALGQCLLDQDRLDLWTRLLKSLLEHTRHVHTLRSTRFTLDLQGSLGTTSNLMRIGTLSARQENVNLLRDFLDLLSSGAIKEVARSCQLTVWPEGQRALRDFVLASAPHRGAAVVDLAGDPDPDVAGLAVECAAVLRPEEAAAVARAAIHHPSESIRFAGVHLASRLPPRERVHALDLLLEAEPHPMHMKIIELLGETGSHEAVEMLLAATRLAGFARFSPEGQAAILAALARSGHVEGLYRVSKVLSAHAEGVLPNLIDHLPGRPPDALRSALLGRLAASRDLPHIRELLSRGARSPMVSVARACRKILSR